MAVLVGSAIRPAASPTPCPSKASTASNKGPGFITIPSPPPNGRSSTVRCRSLVNTRKSCTPTSINPVSRARRTIPWSNGPAKNSGKIVIKSNRIARHSTQTCPRHHANKRPRLHGPSSLQPPHHQNLSRSQRPGQIPWTNLLDQRPPRPSVILRLCDEHSRRTSALTSPQASTIPILPLGTPPILSPPSVSMGPTPILYFRPVCLAPQNPYPQFRWPDGSRRNLGARGADHDTFPWETTAKR